MRKKFLTCDGAVCGAAATLLLGTAACTSASPATRDPNAGIPLRVQVTWLTNRAMCLQDHGFTGAPLPDPDTGQDYWEINAGDPRLPLFKRIAPVCAQQVRTQRQHYLSGSRSTPSASPPASMAQLIDQAAYAQCMRDQGLDNYPNPDPGTAEIPYRPPAGGPPPQVARAGQVCQKAVAQAPRYVSSGSISRPGGVRTLTGLLDAAAYRIEVPRSWNGTLLLYSHGYQPPVGSVSRTDTTHVNLAPTDNPETENWLLIHGYALAASTYSQTGWAVEQALADQVDVLDLFGRTVGRPKRTIAVGESMGGLVAAGLVQLHPDRFDAGLAMCGVVAGGVASVDQGLDGLFVLRTLLDPGNGAGSLQYPTVPDPARQLQAIQRALATAQGTPAGRARVSMVAAILDLPPVPDGGLDATERQQLVWLRDIWASYLSYGIAEGTKRAGGEPAGNAGVDYSTLLQRSVDAGEVAALYGQAGLSVDADLARLARAPRTAAAPLAATYYQRYLQPSGQLSRPVLTLHDTGDPLAVVEQESAYARQVAAAGSQDQLRQLYVDRLGHCQYTPAEAITALQELEHRLDTGSWADLQPARLDAESAALGRSLNASTTAAPPAFVSLQPARLPRS